MTKDSLGIVKRPQVGGDVETQCKKCGESRAHVIVALKDNGEIAKVQCGFCGSNHVYRPAKTKTKTSSTRTTSRSKKESSESSGPPRPYSMQDRFAAGDQIEHPKFGKGTVVEVRSGKIDVKFGRELKTLIHAA